MGCALLVAYHYRLVILSLQMPYQLGKNRHLRWQVRKPCIPLRCSKHRWSTLRQSCICASFARGNVMNAADGLGAHGMPRAVRALK